MKFVHISDLHIGKRLLERSFLEDQEYILRKIVNIVADEKPDAVLIAGDIYDKTIPSAESVEIFDDFLTRLSDVCKNVFAISGNHDSAERIAFGSGLFKKGVYMSPVYRGNIEPITLADKIGDVDIWLLPFIKPSTVRSYHDVDINDYTTAVKTVIEKLKIDKNKRNVLVAHQFVTGAEKSGSEEISIGGLDNVDAKVFKNFDYVALGHIHKKQTIDKKIRYSGTPLKYSFSELKNKNSVTIVELNDELSLKEIELEPKRELKEIKGAFDNVIKQKASDDYYHIVLTDENDIVDGANKLRAVFPNLLKLDYENTRTATKSNLSNIDDLQDKSTLELFDDFFELQNGKKLDSKEKKYMSKVIENVMEEE